MHIRAPRRSDGIHAPHAAHDFLSIERHVLAECSVIPE
jgi:hypothetical protein